MINRLMKIIAVMCSIKYLTSMGLRWAWISSQMDILCTSCFLVMTLLSKMAAHDGHMCLWLYVCVCLSVSVDCKFNCHKKCASQVPKNCLGEMKWSTSESSLAH